MGEKIQMLSDEITGRKSAKERRVLLLKRPVTEKYEDKSTMDRFKFVFYCDCCKNPLPEKEYRFFPRKHRLFRRKPAKNRVMLQWENDYAAAFERANMDMQNHYVHLCEICGKIICKNCAVFCDELGGSVCCKRCLSEKGYHGEHITNLE